MSVSLNWLLDGIVTVPDIGPRDVVDIALTAVASGPTYAAITVVGDNINANDQVYNQVFPYSATPHAGPTNRKDP